MSHWMVKLKWSNACLRRGQGPPLMKQHREEMIGPMNIRNIGNFMQSPLLSRTCTYSIRLLAFQAWFVTSLEHELVLTKQHKINRVEKCLFSEVPIYRIIDGTYSFIQEEWGIEFRDESLLLWNIIISIHILIWQPEFTEMRAGIFRG